MNTGELQNGKKQSITNQLQGYLGKMTKGRRIKG